MDDLTSTFRMPENLERIRIAVIDDHPAVLLGLSNMLSMHADLEVVGTLSSAKQLNTLEVVGGVDVLLIDLRMPDLSGIAAIGIAKRRFPRSHILILELRNR